MTSSCANLESRHLSNRLTVKSNSRPCIFLLLLTVVIAGCAAPSPRFRAVSEERFTRIRGSEVAEIFPVEFKDISLTLHYGNDQLSRGNIENADMYYQLAIGKIGLLETDYAARLKSREDAARRLLEEQERAAAEEFLMQQVKAREQAEEAAKAVARAKMVEAEKVEARRRVERVRPEKEIPPAAVHTVKRGETLPQIAALADVYGDSSLWPLLYRANRDQISNPAVLWPGQVLRIPRNLDRNDLNEARKFSSDRQLR